jgi:type I restriction enzyme R subunit
MSTELGFVEQPMLDWLSGDPKDPNDSGLGWTYRTPEEMEAFGRDLSDPLTEALLVPALMRINDSVDSEGKAKKAIESLRRHMDSPDRLTANRDTLDALRDGLPVVLEDGHDAVTVRFFEFAREDHDLNDFTATNQYVVKGVQTVRADTVLLVNGIPVVLLEYKSFITSGKDWKEGVNQVHRYQREAPALLASNVFCVAADEDDLRFGTVAYEIPSQKVIDIQRDSWVPWLSQYPRRRMYWTLPEEERDEDPVQAAAVGLLSTSTVLDFIANFCVFETRNNKVTKKLARYQQYEAANDIVDRVLDGVFAEGLIWHTQGSGKTLTMVFAASKLRRQPELENPTVFIVVDRSNLKKQVGDDFERTDYPNVVRAVGVSDLKKRIATDRRETIITTVQSFQQMDDLAPNSRKNIIVLIDEAHRSQAPKTAGYATTMRAKLPDARRFGFTGTPIDRTMINTHRDFGPLVEGEQERYLSYYGIRQSILDGTTLEVYYQRRKVPLEADQESLDTGYEDMCEELEIEDEEVKDVTQREQTRWKALARDERRVKKVVDNLVEHFVAHPEPNGFKAQIVCVDRLSCGVYKRLLDAELESRGLPVEWSEVIISWPLNDYPELEHLHYSSEQIEEFIEYFKLTPAEWEAYNLDRFGPDRASWRQPLKFLIVSDMLLTGFDAPVEQVMYLDKPLRDHNLLQAIARTNRPLPEMDKRNGLVVDYFGVFDDLQRALNFDEAVREEALIEWDQLRGQLPGVLGVALAFFEGIPFEDTRDALLSCLRRLVDDKVGVKFTAAFRRLQTLWEALAPDEVLYPHRKEYAWLCGVYVAYRRRVNRRPTTHGELAAKTKELIEEHTEFMDVAEDLPVYKIDENYLTKVGELPNAADRAAELQAALARELSEDNAGFVYKKLGERLKKVVERKQSEDAHTQATLEELEAIVEGLNKAKSEPERLELTGHGEYGLYRIIREYGAIDDEVLASRAARHFVSYLRDHAYMPPGWGATVGGRQRVALALHVLAWEDDFAPLQLVPEDPNAEQPFIDAAVEELASIAQTS